MEEQEKQWRKNQEIMQRYARGEATEAEQAMVENWYITLNTQDFDLTPEELTHDLQSLKRKLDAIAPKNPNYWLYAAASVLLVGMLYFLWPMLVKQEILVTVGAGQTKSVRLPDSSTVVLNARSTLRYSNKFSGSRRLVELEGEGYFVIAKSGPDASGSSLRYEKRFLSPFIVKTPHQEITVLGTEFNVKAFPADSVERISLVTGSVLVKSATDTIHLRPGQQEIYSNGKSRIGSMEPGASTAWKDGFFDFFHKPAEEVLHELSRWYGFELVHAEAIPNKELVGRMPKTLKLTTVLVLLRDAGINIRMEGDKRMIIL